MSKERIRELLDSCYEELLGLREELKRRRLALEAEMNGENLGMELKSPEDALTDEDNEDFLTQLTSDLNWLDKKYRMNL